MCKRKSICIIIAIFVLCFLTACSSGGGSGKKVQGIWLADGGWSYSFAKDGTFYWLGGRYKKPGTYVIENDQLILNEEGYSERYSFSLENDTLTLFREGYYDGTPYKKIGTAEKSATNFETKISSLEGLYLGSEDDYVYFYSDGTADYAIKSIYDYGKTIEQQCNYKNENGKLTFYLPDGKTIDSFQFELNDSSIILYHDSSSGTIYQRVNPDYQSESDMLDYVIQYMANKFSEFVEEEEENTQYAVRWLTSYDAGPQHTHYASSEKAGWDATAIDKNTFFVKYAYQAYIDYYKTNGTIYYTQHGYIPFECSFKDDDIQITTVLDDPQLKEKYIQLGLLTGVENQQTSNDSSSGDENNTAQSTTNNDKTNDDTNTNINSGKANQSSNNLVNSSAQSFISAAKADPTLFKGHTIGEVIDAFGNDYDLGDFCSDFPSGAPTPGLYYADGRTPCVFLYNDKNGRQIDITSSMDRNYSVYFVVEKAVIDAEIAAAEAAYNEWFSALSTSQEATVAGVDENGFHNDDYYDPLTGYMWPELKNRILSLVDGEIQFSYQHEKPTKTIEEIRPFVFLITFYSNGVEMSQLECTYNPDNGVLEWDD